MERQARVSFRVIRINRWSLAVALLVALGVLLLPLGRLLPSSGNVPGRVKPGVSLLGRDLTAHTAAEVRAVLTELARSAGAPPVDARRVMQTVGTATAAYMVPDLAGYRLDVERTFLKVMTSPAGAAVEPVWAPWPAVVSAGEYPDAVIRQANSGKPAVALLINVAWGTEHLPDMLVTLKKHGARATFLVTGQWAQKNADLLRTMAADGHEIGNHGWDANRSPLELLGKGQIRQDIEKADTAIAAVLGRQARYYQPHMGELDRGGRIVKTARELGYTTVLWTPGQDTIDWRKDTTAAKVLERVADVKAGDIILMHPTEPSRKALAGVLEIIRNKNLRPLTLSEILSSQPIPPGSTSARPPGR